ncbi:hypothetical protein [Streptomyces sp. TE33382]
MAARARRSAGLSGGAPGTGQAGVICRVGAAGALPGRAGDPDIVIVGDAGYDVMRLARQPGRRT